MPTHWKITGRVKLLDAANNFVQLLGQERAEALLRSGRVYPVIERGKVRAVRWTQPGAFLDELAVPCALRKPGAGSSHRNERQDNPKGTWTIDRVRRSERGLFLAVVTDCLTKNEESAATPRHASAPAKPGA